MLVEVVVRESEEKSEEVDAQEEGFIIGVAEVAAGICDRRRSRSRLDDLVVNSKAGYGGRQASGYWSSVCRQAGEMETGDDQLGGDTPYSVEN